MDFEDLLAELNKDLKFREEYQRQKPYYDILFEDVRRHASGGCIQLRPELNFLPVSVGSDDQLRALYESVEFLGGVVDYDEIRKEFPNLSFVEINNAISLMSLISAILSS